MHIEVVKLGYQDVQNTVYGMKPGFFLISRFGCAIVILGRLPASLNFWDFGALRQVNN